MQVIPEENSKEETLVAIDERIKELVDEGGVEEEDGKAVGEVMKVYWECFANKLGRVKRFTHTIDTGEVQARAARMHNQSVAQEEEAARQVKGMLERGLIEQSASEWATSVVLVKK